jgi:hypothetical protein
MKMTTRLASFYDYANDMIYVSDVGGNLHKFTGVFNGTPAEAGAPWPLQVDANSFITGPVLDSKGTPRSVYVSANAQAGSGGLLAYFALPSPSSSDARDHHVEKYWPRLCRHFGFTRRGLYQGPYICRGFDRYRRPQRFF